VLLITLCSTLSPGIARAEDPKHRLGLRGGINLLLFRGRDEGARTEEILAGPTLVYERTVLPERFRLGVAGPVYLADSRMDFPMTLFGKVIHRGEAWDFYFAPGLAVIGRFFNGDRRNQEGRGDELSIGGRMGLGASYRLTDAWHLDFDGGYTFIPVNSVVSHELALGAGVSYGF
jgi:hypothetical protein